MWHATTPPRARGYGAFPDLRLWRSAAYDRANLAIFWLRDGSLDGSENLPPVLIATEITKNLEVALGLFGEIHDDLRLPVTE